MIIHISGESGAGKTTMMRELAKLPSNYIFKDFDDMWNNQVYSDQDGQSFRKYLDRFFSEYRNVVIVGMNVGLPNWFNDSKLVDGFY